MKIKVVGLGPGGHALMTNEAVNAVTDADIVITSVNRGDLSELSENVEYVRVSDMTKRLRELQGRVSSVAVVASGDTGFYSIAVAVGKSFPDGDIEFCPGITSFSCLAARLKTSYSGAGLISLHGRSGSIVPYAAYNKKIFVLTGGATKVSDAVSALCEAGMGENLSVSVGEDLSMPEEKITTGTPSQLVGMSFSEIAVMMVENPNPADTSRTVQDAEFTRGKVPMTKRDVRELVCSALEINPADTVYDVGAGTGAASCAFAYKAREGMVYAIERNPEGIELIDHNRRTLGAYNVRTVSGTAPEALCGLPPASKVFVGGSAGRLGEILDACKRDDGRPQTLVVTAVTLETLSEATCAFGERCMEPEVTCINVSHAERLGSYSLMKAENPIYIIRGKR